MPSPPNAADQAASEDDAHQAARDAARPTRPETDPGSARPGARAYEDRPVEGLSQGPLSPGASEPSDMGRPDGGEREPRPQEHDRADGIGYRG